MIFNEKRCDMIKSELVDAVRDRLGAVTSKQTWEYVSFISAQISEALEPGEPDKITNFDVYDTRHKNARLGRNPKTLVEAEIPARTVVRFRLNNQLFNRLNPDEKISPKS